MSLNFPLLKAQRHIIILHQSLKNPKSKNPIPSALDLRFLWIFYHPPKEPIITFPLSQHKKSLTFPLLPQNHRNHLLLHLHPQSQHLPQNLPINRIQSQLLRPRHIMLRQPQPRPRNLSSRNSRTPIQNSRNPIPVASHKCW